MRGRERNPFGRLTPEAAFKNIQWGLERRVQKRAENAHAKLRKIIERSHPIDGMVIPEIVNSLRGKTLIDAVEIIERLQPEWKRRIRRPTSRARLTALADDIFSADIGQWRDGIFYSKET